MRCSSALRSRERTTMPPLGASTAERKPPLVASHMTAPIPQLDASRLDSAVDELGVPDAAHLRLVQKDAQPLAHLLVDVHRDALALRAAPRLAGQPQRGRVEDVRGDLLGRGPVAPEAARAGAEDDRLLGDDAAPRPASGDRRHLLDLLVRPLHREPPELRGEADDLDPHRARGPVDELLRLARLAALGRRDLDRPEVDPGVPLVVLGAAVRLQAELLQQLVVAVVAVRLEVPMRVQCAHESSPRVSSGSVSPRSPGSRPSCLAFDAIIASMSALALCTTSSACSLSDSAA